ncbi:MAG: DUF192 domain-containing protein [Actinobacteria bacterium]|nr:DUF192 domain-containing protein [Actinomycetota bacterium]
MHIRLASVVVILGLLLAGCASEPARDATVPSPDASVEAAPSVPPLHPSVDDYPETVVTLSGPDDGRERVAVKVADTSERRQHGLMEVEELPAGTGMVFVFGEDHEGAFWMKDTLVPLDIAFIASDGDVREILQMEPCREDPCPRYGPGVSYRYALEVPRGWFAEVGVDEDWTLERPLPAPSG